MPTGRELIAQAQESMPSTSIQEVVPGIETGQKLVVLDVPRQLHSHLRGALNVGAADSAVDAALRVGLEFAQPEAGQRASETWQSVRAPAGQEG